MGVASLVIGIIALLFSLIPLLGILGVYVALPGLLLGILQIFWPKKKKGLAIAGVILSILACMISFAQYKAGERALTHVNSVIESNVKTETNN